MKGLVNFETAKLIAKAGIDFPKTYYVYYTGRNKGTWTHRCCPQTYKFVKRKHVAAPMINDVIEYLRNEMFIYVEVVIIGLLNNNPAFKYKAHLCEFVPYMCEIDGITFQKERCRINLFCQGKKVLNEYDVCLEQALQHVFETIIKEKEEKDDEI